MTVTAPQIIPLDVSAIVPDGTVGWRLRRAATDGDDLESPFRSRLRLLEDGKLLGPSHTTHDLIRTYGGGRFSHWRNDLLFSTSDNSDPRTNGRQYVIQIGGAEDDTVAMPSTMHVGITSACNLTCRICRTEDQMHGNTLSDEVIDHLVAEAFPHLGELRLDVAGEPTLHRRKFMKLVSEATRHNVSVFMCTNGALIDRELADFICNSSVYSVQVSMDSANADRLEWVRRGIRNDDLLNGLRHLVEARRAAGREKTMNIHLHAAVLRQTIDDLPDLVRLAHEYGVEQVSCYFGFIHKFMDCDWSPFWDRERHNQKIDEAFELGKELGVRFSYWGKFNLDADPTAPPVRPDGPPPQCNYLRQWTYVDPSGYLAPCCISPMFSLGNLKFQGFKDVWYGPTYAELRKTHNTDAPSNPKCAACYIMVGWNKDSYKPFFDADHWPEVRRRLGLPPEDQA